MKTAMAPTTYIEWHSTATIEGLEIYVTSLEQKSDMDGHEVLNVGLRLRFRGEEHLTGFSGRDSDMPSETWNGFKVEFRGGSKQAVGLAVTKLP